MTVNDMEQFIEAHPRVRIQSVVLHGGVRVIVTRQGDGTFIYTLTDTYADRSIDIDREHAIKLLWMYRA